MFSPCGICRELISEYGDDPTVIVPGDDGPLALPVSTALPFPAYPK